jgi:hypothetical protein
MIDKLINFIFFIFFEIKKIQGSYNNNKCARDALCSLILGSPPGKVYS